MSRPIWPILLSILACLWLPGCVSQLLPKSPPRALHGLAERDWAPAGRPLQGAIWVEVPQAAAPYDGRDIVVRRGNGEVQVLPGIAWLGRSPRLLQELLLEAIEGSGAAELAVQGPAAHALRWRLASELRRFGLVERSDGSLRAELALSARLVCVAEARVLADRRFRLSSQVPAQQPAAAPALLAELAAQFAEELTQWLGHVDSAACREP